MSRLMGLVLSVLMLLLPLSVSAELKIGLIDQREAIVSTEAAKAFREKVLGQFKQQDLEVRAAGEDVQKMELKLKNDAAIMSDGERAKLRADLETKFQEFKYLKSKLDKALSEKLQDFYTDSNPKLDKAINEVVNENGLDLLLPKQAAIYFKTPLDLTQQVVEKLNKMK